MSSSKILKDEDVEANQQHGAPLIKDDDDDDPDDDMLVKEPTTSHHSSFGETLGNAASAGATFLDRTIQAALPPLTRYQKLMTDEDTRRWSLNVLTFGIFADALTGTILQPNYAIMASPGADKESFSSTSPFDFSSATYFIPMTALLGVAVASAVTGQLSDRTGRKPILLMCFFGSMVGTSIKWVLREDFWPFCVANFANGLMSGGLPVAMAYIGDVFERFSEKQEHFGVLVGFWVLGNSIGGVVAILMANQGLFAPLWVGVAFEFAALVLASIFLIEPRSLKLLHTRAKVTSTDFMDDDEEEAGLAGPETINKPVMYNIIGGSLFDNVGSNALFPLCLSPLAFEHFYQDFVERGESPVLTLDGYKWMSVLVALMVIPSTIISPPLFNRIGAAGTCVMGNVITGLLTIALLYLGSADATKGYLGGFVTAMYVGFPFTVISQLTTGPMLDHIAPLDQRGYVQGLNSIVMNLATAVAPWVLGLLADNVSTPVAIWTGIGVSFAAAVVNAPLMRVPGLGAPKKKLPPSKRPMKFEDKDLIERMLKGEYVPAADREKINDERVDKGLPFVVARTQDYETDKPRLDKLRKEALADFTYLRNRNIQFLNDIGQEDPEKLNECLRKVNKSMGMVDEEETKELEHDIGQWFTDYLRESGYRVHLSPVLAKQMIMTAFPPLMRDEDFTPENIEQFLIHEVQLYNQYVHTEEDRGHTLHNMLGRGGVRTLYG